MTLEDGGTKVDPAELESISIVVRNVTFESQGNVVGESLDPYDIQIDDVSFY